MEYEVSIDKVVEGFKNLVGEKTATDGYIFCRTAANTVNSWLDLKKELSSHDEEISYAAATIAYYRFTLKNSGENDSIKAGDITVTDNSEKSVAFAEKLMKDAIKSIEPYLKPKRFAFIGTEV
jgi:hypothetical protein